MELDLPVSQILGLFNRIIHKFHKLFCSLEEAEAAAKEPKQIAAMAAACLHPVKESIEEELVIVNI